MATTFSSFVVDVFDVELAALVAAAVVVVGVESEVVRGQSVGGVVQS